jgi:hypothetical protein
MFGDGIKPIKALCGEDRNWVAFQLLDFIASKGAFYRPIWGRCVNMAGITHLPHIGL